MRWTPVTGAHRADGLHLATFSDLSGEDDELRLWRHRAHHDALTGLPNREHLGAELERGIARAARHAHRLALLFIDLDGFKQVNDRHGHAAGDRVLAHAGIRLRQALRAEDFVARLGGDEFVALLNAPREATDALTAGQTLLHALAGGPGGATAAPGAVTASIGIALYPDHARDAQELLRVADAAMYRVKRAGGNTLALGDAAPLGRRLQLEPA